MPLQEKAYLALQEMIENNELELGTVYSETKLSQMLNISRTPLRSALNRMVQDGYIDVLPSRGFVLHEMTNSEFLGYVDNICAIENFAVFSCMQNLKRRGKCLTVLQRIQAQMETADSDKLRTLNHQFHNELIQVNTNFVMNRNYHNTMHLMRIQHAVKEFDGNDRKKVLEQHAELIRRLQSGETDGLFEYVNEHIRYELIQK